MRTIENVVISACFLLFISPSLVQTDALSFYGKRTAEGIAGDLNEIINSALDNMAKYPRRYPYWQKTRFQRCVLARFPYAIFYEAEPTRVHVLALARTSRRPGYWKKRIAVD